VAQIGVLEVMDELVQHRSSGALEAQDERLALPGMPAELDHLHKPKNYGARLPNPHPELTADHSLKIGGNERYQISRRPHERRSLPRALPRYRQPHPSRPASAQFGQLGTKRA
jgi:hypothetical protein